MTSIQKKGVLIVLSVLIVIFLALVVWHTFLKEQDPFDSMVEKMSEQDTVRAVQQLSETDTPVLMQAERAAAVKGLDTIIQQKASSDAALSDAEKAKAIKAMEARISQ